VVIDLIGYRKHGHNEVDEPKFTQPLMYDKIAKHPSPVSVYKSRLLAEGAFTPEEMAKVEAHVGAAYDAAWDKSQTIEIPTDTWRGTQASDSPWMKMKVPRQAVKLHDATGLDFAALKKVGASLTKVPEGFTLHRNLKKLNKAKDEMFASEKNVDWATGEALAIGSLLLEVRGGSHMSMLAGRKRDESHLFSMPFRLLYPFFVRFGDMRQSQH